MITGKYLVYDEPGYPWVSVPGTIHPSYAIFEVDGRNHLTTSKYIGYRWVITQGFFNVRQEHEVWSSIPIPGNSQTNFGAQGPAINFDALGDWRIVLTMLAGEERYDPNAQQIDTYAGPLCTVSLAPFQGTLTQMAVIETATGYGTEIPGDLPEIGLACHLRVVARNDMDTTQALGVNWSVKNPSGEVVQQYSLNVHDWPDVPSGQGAMFTGLDIDFNTPGAWLVNIEMKMNVAAPELVDRYTGVLVNVPSGGNGDGGNGGGGSDWSWIIWPTALAGIAIVAMVALGKRKK